VGRRCGPAHLWDAEQGLGNAFPEIDAISMAGRFRDCEHTVSPDVRSLPPSSAVNSQPNGWRTTTSSCASGGTRNRVATNPRCGAQALGEHRQPGDEALQGSLSAAV